MSWFKKKDQAQIPPVAGDNAPAPAPMSDYSRRQKEEADANRDALLGGPRRPPPSRSASGGQRQDLGNSYGEQAQDDGEDEEEMIKSTKADIRKTKEDSVNSTRNALRYLREAQETGNVTFGRLGDQSEKLANTERHLDVTKGHSVRADDKTDELKKLNRSIFRPAITFNKDAKRAAQEAKIQARYENEREEKEKAYMDVRETQERLGQWRGEASEGEEGIGRGRPKTDAQLEQRKRFQFEATASDDEMEDELDDNLNELLAGAKALRGLSGAISQELDVQNTRIGNIEAKTVNVDNMVYRNTERLKKIK